MQIVKSVCPFCGVGCRLRYMVENNRITKVLPDKEDPVSFGRPCIKGLSISTLDFNKRIKKPLKREDGKFIEISYEEAIKEFVKLMRSTDPCRTAFYLSSLTTNEVIYAFLEIAKALGIHNIDNCARVCHAATVKAMQIAFGTSGMVAKYDDLLKCDAVLIFGSDPYAAYPVIFNRLMDIKKRGASIIVFEDIFSYTKRFASKVYKIKPASHKIVAIGIAKAVGSDDEVFQKYLEGISWNFIEKKTGITRNTYKKLADSLKGKKVAIMFGMTVTQNGFGTETVLALANLAILLGAYFVPMRGKINVQGAGDLGAKPRGDGMPATVFFYSKDIDLYVIHDSNPIKSFPMSNKVRERLEEAKVIYIGHYMNETAEVADLIIPGTFLFEENGTVITAERRVRKVNRVIEPEVMSLYEFLSRVAKEIGIALPRDEEQMYLKITMEIPLLRGVKPEEFARKVKKWELLVPIPPRVKEFEDKVLMTTKRRIYQFTTAEITSHIETLRKVDEGPVAYISKELADLLGIEKEAEIEVSSDLGSIRCRAKVNGEVIGKAIVLPFHYSEIPVNSIMPLEIDPLSFEPNLKYLEVEVRKANS